MHLDLINTINDPGNTQDQNADFVIFTSTYRLTKFTFDNKEYQFALAGFSQDGENNYLSQLKALEGEKSSTAKYYAKIIEIPTAATPPPPPLPPTNSYPDDDGTLAKQRVPRPRDTIWHIFGGFVRYLSSAIVENGEVLIFIPQII